MSLMMNFSINKWTESMLSTVDSEMFARTLFSLIFANSSPHKIKDHTSIVNTDL